MVTSKHDYARMMYSREKQQMKDALMSKENSSIFQMMFAPPDASKEKLAVGRGLAILVILFILFIFIPLGLFMITWLSLFMWIVEVGYGLVGLWVIVGLLPRIIKWAISAAR